MADNNKNPRRTIWLSETEPLSHYDIWLSKNQHLNSDGLPISDTGVLRPCDYIFKVWDCDNWYPIIGFNSTAVNKIDTVFNTTYIDSHNHSHTSYHEFHLPLFTKPENSPSELFDAGTIGEAIYLYVTELEWLNIFEGDAFTNAFEYYFPTIINNGGININTLIKPAEKTKLGGIWADEFSIEDMFPDSEAQYSHPSSRINDSYNWIALAKYKYHHDTNSSHLDYNLYVNAKDVIEAINNYITNNPGAPGIQPGNDFEWRLATVENIGGIKADTHDDAVDAIYGIQVKFGNQGVYDVENPLHQISNEFLCITSLQLYNLLKKIDPTTQTFPIGTENGLYGRFENIGTELNPEYIPTLGINGVTEDNVGKVPIVVPSQTSQSGYDIEWVDLPEYERLGPDSVEANNYVVKGCGNSKLYLNGAGEWTPPSGPDYWGDQFIYVDRTEARITLAPIRETGSFYIDCTNGILDWKRVKSGEYPTLSPSNHNAGTSYVINGCNEPSAAKFFLNGEGGWTEISGGSSGSTSYLSGVGINIDNDDNSININIPDGTAEGLVLSYDGHGDVEWVNPPSLVEGNGINTFINNNKIYIQPYLCFIDANDFTLDTSVLIDVSSLTPYPNNHYPLTSFVDYLAQHQNGISSIKIESNYQVYLQLPSYLSFETSTKCTFTFPKSMEFIETESVNSSTHEDCFYTDTDYIILLKPATKYNVTFYKSCIKFETNSNSIFDEPFNE